MRSFPTYETMFSDNPRYSRNALYRHAKNDSDVNNLNLTEKMVQGPIRDVKVAQVNRLSVKPSTPRISTSDILGKYRSRYFASPVTGHSAPSKGLSQGTLSFNDAIKADFRADDMAISSAPPATRNRGTQTDYRDSETQTVPYSPPYSVQPGINPEVLLIKHLTWDNGLPAGQLEVEMIQRARSRRAGRVELDGFSSDRDVKKWKKLLQSTDTPIETVYYQEERQENYRDNKLELLAKSLKDLREKHGDLVQERLRALWKRRHREKEKKTRLFSVDKNRELRRMEAKKNTLMPVVGANDSLPPINGDSKYVNNNNNNEFLIEDLQNNRKTIQTYAYQKKAATIGLNNLSKYSELPGLDEIIPSLIIATRNNSSKYLGNSFLPFSRPIRKNKLDRDLEEAYLKILEKKQNETSDFNLNTPGYVVDSPKKSNHNNEDAQTQTENVEGKGPNTVMPQSDEQQFLEEELSIVLEKLLKEHWEAIDEYFSSLLLKRRTFEETVKE